MSPDSPGPPFKKRVLVTGGTGFVGANLTRRLLRDGHDVHLLVRPGFQPWRIAALQSDVQLHETDFHDVEVLEAATRCTKPDWIFHCAAHGGYSWQTDARLIVDTNLTATMNLVHAALKVGFEAFVQAGSSSEYGFKDHAPSEAEAAEPNSYYAFSKAAATSFCGFIARTHKVHIPTLRLYSVFGPFEDPNRLMPWLILEGLQHRLPALVNPEIARDFVYVDDVCDAFVLAASASTRDLAAVYNIGSGVQTTLAELVALARRELRIEDEPRWGSMPDRTWDTASWVADSGKARRELGWSVKHSLEENFRLMVDWLRDPSMLEFYSAAIKRG